VLCVEMVWVPRWVQVAGLPDTSGAVYPVKVFRCGQV
jgi:hypothetical protein